MFCIILFTVKKIKVTQRWGSLILYEFFLSSWVSNNHHSMPETPPSLTDPDKTYSSYHLLQFPL